MFIGGLQSLVGAAVLGEFSTFSMDSVTPLSAGALLYLVIFGAIIAYTCYFWLLLHTRTVVAISYEYVNPVIGVFLGWLLAGEQVDGVIVMACCLTVLFRLLHRFPKARMSASRPVGAGSRRAPPVSCTSATHGLSARVAGLPEQRRFARAAHGGHRSRPFPTRVRRRDHPRSALARAGLGRGRTPEDRQGPYVQSARMGLYADALNRLDRAGHIYPATVPARSFARWRVRPMWGRRGAYPGTRRRNLPPERRAELEAAGRRPCIRLRCPSQNYAF